MATSVKRAEQLVQWLMDESDTGHGGDEEYARFAKHMVLEEMGVQQDLGMFIEPKFHEAQRYFYKHYMGQAYD